MIFDKLRFLQLISGRAQLKFYSPLFVTLIAHRRRRCCFRRCRTDGAYINRQSNVHFMDL